MLKIENIKLTPEEPEEILVQRARKIIGAPIQHIEILRKSIDARKKDELKCVYTIACTCTQESRILSRKLPRHVQAYAAENYQFPQAEVAFSKRPVIIGAGPAGLFCALMLARAGHRPIIFERGKAVEEREQDVSAFWAQGTLDEQSNVQFGEGGAGTFSDGKLNTGTSDPRHRFILQTLVEFGAPEDICYSATPHIGTDLLRDVIKNLRQHLLSLGASIYFSHQMTGLKIDRTGIQAVIIRSNHGEMEVPTQHVCCAIGHSARDTFQMLYAQGVPLQQKAFAMGVRIEHLQQHITKAQYGQEYPNLPVPGYKLACHLPNGRSAFSFCVCPGGVVVASASEKNMLATNGMSYRARNGKNINGALLVGINPSDFGSAHPLAGFALQRELEKAAFIAGGSNYHAPCQSVADFLNKVPSKGFGEVCPSYRPGVTPTDLHQCLPGFITNTLEEALPMLGKKLQGYDHPAAVLTAIESRSSSPVRIVRDKQFQSAISGLYPCGEGAGYAGGIISAATDGIKCAEKMCQQAQA